MHLPTALRVVLVPALLTVMTCAHAQRLTMQATAAEQQMDCPGEWAQLPAGPEGVKRATRSCPFYIEGDKVNASAHFCSHPRQEMVSSLRRFVFSRTAHSSCSAFEPQRFLRTFSNSRLVFIGDSVLSQVWLLLVCDVYESLPAAQRDNDSFVTFNPRAGMVATRLGHGGYTLGRDIVTFLEHNVTVIGTRWDFFYKKQSAAAILRDLSESDILVVNFGLHYNEYAGKNPRDADRDDFRNALVALSADLAALGRPKWGIWFAETTPQHFAGDNANGYYNLHGGKSCVPYANATAAHLLDWRNTVLHDRATSLLPDNVRLVALPALSSQWDAHLEMDTRTGDGLAAQHPHHGYLHFADCTHWCNPSAALRYVLSALLSQISRDLTLT